MVRRASEVGVDTSSEKVPGYFYQVDSIVKMYRSMVPGLEIMRIEEALEQRFDEVKPYVWRLVGPDTDKYVALVALRGVGGFFIRVKKNTRVSMPVQTCFFLTSGAQLLHNVVVLEPGAELTLVTGCTVMRERPGLHVGVTEAYVGEGAKLIDVMVHSWNEAMHVRPRTAVEVEQGGSYVSYYVNLSRVKTLQTLPRVKLVGDNAQAYAASIVLGLEDAHLDVGNHVELSAPSTSAQNISKVVARDRSKVVSRIVVEGGAPHVKGYIECSGLMLSPEAFIETVPVLRSRVREAELYHEASIGRLRDEDVAYLIAKGFTEREAVAMLIRGFVEVDLRFLTPQLVKALRKVLDMVAERSL